MIITLTNEKINTKIKNNFPQINFVSKKTLMLLSECSLFFNQYKEYRILFNYKDWQLLCPILYINNKQLLLIPAIKLPRRKYPCYVYLFAVIKYISSDLNMRQVASLTRLTFGLDSFSASTVCRIVNKFVEINDQFKNNLKVENIKLNPRISLCRKLTKKIALNLFSSFKNVLKNPITYTTQLIYKHFCKTGSFLF